MLNAQDQALALCARARGLVDPDRLERARRGPRLPGEALGELLLRLGLTPPDELARRLDLLRATPFACRGCGAQVAWGRLAGLPQLSCPLCRGELAPPAGLAGSTGQGSGSALVRSDTAGNTAAPPGGGGLAFRAPVLPEPPTRLGPWTLLARIGRGANGVVYLARREGLERRFALKLLLPDRDDPEDLARFQLEAAAASRVQDPGVVAVYEAGELGPFHYYAMEHCPGPTLKERLRDGPLPWPEAARLVASLARAVAAAHRAGVLHRDLKPANVILDQSQGGRPRLTDFGLARARDLSRSLTKSGDVIGTPLYMAPEQLRGEKARDPRVDVYGLGGVLYAALTGRPPHEATTILALTRLKQETDPDPPHQVLGAIPPALSAVCLRALARDPAARTPSAEALARELEGLLAATPGPRPGANGAAAPRPARPALLVALGLLVGVGAGAGAAALLRGEPPATAGPVAPSPAPPPSRPAPPPPPPPPPALPSLEWGLLCWMPYDNHLSAHGEGILAELAAGATSPSVGVAVQADFQGPGGSRRYLFRRSPREDDPGKLRGHVEPLEKEEGSATPEALRAFLEWGYQALPARRVAVVILGPSGRLDETCWDQAPQGFLEVPALAAALCAFRDQVRARGGEVELLFLQQAARGALEIFHALRGAARVLMAAQGTLGAPNSYYRAALAGLGQGQVRDGRELARTIAENDAANMFLDYTALDGEALGELPRRLDAVLTPLLQGPVPTLDREALGAWVTYSHRDETLVDGLALLRALHHETVLDEAPLRGLETFVKERLVVHRRVSPRAATQQPRAAEWCGFSLYLPTRAADLTRYDERWSLLRETRLRELWTRLVPR